jgi:hypothetical protein
MTKRILVGLGIAPTAFCAAHPAASLSITPEIQRREESPVGRQIRRLGPLAEWLPSAESPASDLSIK